MGCGFVLPVNGENPPAFAIIKKLNAVDASHKRFRIGRGVARFVSAPNMRDATELFSPSGDFCFVKTFLLEQRLDPRNVPFDVQNLRRKIGVVLGRSSRGWNQTRAGIKERAFPLPIAPYSRRPGDDIVSAAATIASIDSTSAGFTAS